MADISTVRQDVAHTEQLVGEMTKDQVAEAARLLAINVAQYWRKYGDLPIQDAARLMHADRFSEDELRVIALGMQILVASLTLSQQDFVPSGET